MSLTTLPTFPPKLIPTLPPDPPFTLPRGVRFLTLPQTLPPDAAPNIMARPSSPEAAPKHHGPRCFLQPFNPSYDASSKAQLQMTAMFCLQKEKGPK